MFKEQRKSFRASPELFLYFFQRQIWLSASAAHRTLRRASAFSDRESNRLAPRSLRSHSVLPAARRITPPQLRREPRAGSSRARRRRENEHQLFPRLRGGEARELHASNGQPVHERGGRGASSWSSACRLCVGLAGTRTREGPASRPRSTRGPAPVFARKIRLFQLVQLSGESTARLASLRRASSVLRDGAKKKSARRENGTRD